MGGCQSQDKPRVGEPGSTPTAASSSPKQSLNTYSWEKNKSKDPNDYIIHDLENATVVKNCVYGEQFNIEALKNCDIFILDYSATVFVDLCTDCRIYIGPVESSVFVRECTGCKIVCAAQQFRTRDCQNLDISLLCQTEPVIETSSNIRFGCFNFSYFSLAEQCRKAKLNVWCNKWWQVHDFNKDDEGHSQNWSFLESREMLVDKKKSGLDQFELDVTSAVPFTTMVTKTAAMLFFLPDTEVAINRFLDEALVKQWQLGRTRSFPLRGVEAKEIIGQDLTTGEVIGVEIGEGESTVEEVYEAVKAFSQTLGQGVKFYSGDIAKLNAIRFFKELKDVI